MEFFEAEQKMIPREFRKSKLSNLDKEKLFQETQPTSVTRLGDLLDFGQLFKAFGNN